MGAIYSFSGLRPPHDGLQATRFTYRVTFRVRHRPLTIPLPLRFWLLLSLLLRHAILFHCILLRLTALWSTTFLLCCLVAAITLIATLQ
jgi:hypothetical protein